MKIYIIWHIFSKDSLPLTWIVYIILFFLNTAFFKYLTITEAGDISYPVHILSQHWKWRTSNPYPGFLSLGRVLTFFHPGHIFYNICMSHNCHYWLSFQGPYPRSLIIRTSQDPARRKKILWNTKSSFFKPWNQLYF